MDVPQQITIPFNTTYVPFGMIRDIVKTFAIQIRQFLGAFDVFLLTVTGFGIPNNESSDLNQVMQVLWEVCSACDEFGD